MDASAFDRLVRTLSFAGTRGRSFCGGSIFIGTCGCMSNRQCENQAGKGAKCVQGGVNCAFCGSVTDTACVIQCPNLATAP